MSFDGGIILSVGLSEDEFTRKVGLFSFKSSQLAIGAGTLGFSHADSARAVITHVKAAILRAERRPDVGGRCT